MKSFKKLRNLTKNKMQNTEDYIETWGVVLAAIGVTLTDVETTLKIVSLLLAIAFTAYKFYVTIKKRNLDK